MTTRSTLFAFVVLLLAVGCSGPAASTVAEPKDNWTTVQSLAFSFDTDVDFVIDHVPARLAATTPDVCSITLRMPEAMTSTIESIGGPQNLTVELTKPGKYSVGGKMPAGSVIKVQVSGKAGT